MLGPRASIQARLQLSHLISSLVPLLVLGIVLLYTSAQAERRVVEQTQSSVAGAIAFDVVERIGRFESELLKFGREVPVSSNNRNIVATTSSDFMSRQFPNALEIALLDLQGKEIVRVSQERVYFDAELQNRIDELFFNSAKDGVIHRSVTRAVDGQRALQIAVPARNSVGQVTGVVVALFSTQQIEQRLAQVAPSIGRSTFIVDGSGSVLLGQAPDALAYSRDLRLWAAMDNTVTTLQGTDGSDITAARAPLKLGSWSVVIEQPTEIAFYSLRRNTLLLGLMLLVTAAVVIVWVVLLARELTRPILQLRDGVQVLGSGQLGGMITVARDDELGQLAHEFNSMSERLAASQRAIEQRNARLSEGLDLARIIQRDLLPQSTPANTTITAHAASEAAIEIGGDFYTYVPLADGRIRLIIGDASGKGVAAALVMALTSSLVELEARKADSPAALLTLLNAELYARFNANHMCVALLVAEFDPYNNEVCVANAGMIAPLVVAEECTYIPCYGPPLGIVDHVAYTQTTVQLEPSQVVVFVSDGIVEARNAADEMWGFHNLETTVCDAASSGVHELVTQVLAAVKSHVHHTPRADDMTIIAATLSSLNEKNNEYELVPMGDEQPHGYPAAHGL